MEVPKLRGSRQALQAIEGQGEVVILQDGVEDENGPPLQGGLDEDDVPDDLFYGLAGEDLLDGPAPRLFCRLGEQEFVLGTNALLTGELEVALVPAVQIGLNEVPGNPGSHDATLGGDSARPPCHEYKRRDHRTWHGRCWRDG